LNHIGIKALGYWYRVKNIGAEGWLCPALFRYFETAPESIYVKAERSRVTHESTVSALKDRIEKLEQLVGKLTLENEALKKGR